MYCQQGSSRKAVEGGEYGTAEYGERYGPDEVGKLKIFSGNGRAWEDAILLTLMLFVLFVLSSSGR